MNPCLICSLLELWQIGRMHPTDSVLSLLLQVKPNNYKGK